MKKRHAFWVGALLALAANGAWYVYQSPREPAPQAPHGDFKQSNPGLRKWCGKHHDRPECK